MVNKKTESKNFLDSVFSHHFLPMSGNLFFQITKNDKFSPNPILKIFRAKVLDTDQGCHKAACTGAALSKFHLSVGDGATYWTGCRRHEAPVF